MILFASCADKSSVTQHDLYTGREPLLKLTYGTMAAGKSTLALQMVWQLKEAGTNVALWTFGDRSMTGKVTSRIGISADATHVHPGDSLNELIESLVLDKMQVVVVDEAQFATPEQVDSLALLVDDHKVSVHCFALATDFRTQVFAGTSRLFALADVTQELPLVTYCWCGRTGRCNARIVNDEVVYSGEQIAIGDVGEDAAASEDSVRYEILCRKHYRNGQLKS